MFKLLIAGSFFGLLIAASTEDDLKIVVTSTDQAQPDLSRCFKIGDLVKAVDNFYLKSYCTVREVSSHIEASKFCVDRGMKLLVIENSDVEAAIFKTISELFPGATGWYWINKNTSGYVKIPARKCLLYSNTKGPWKPIASICSKNAWFICEFSK